MLVETFVDYSFVDMKVTQWSSPNHKPTEKEKQSLKKKTLKEVAGNMLSDMIEKAHEERMKAIREKQREEEDEIAAMTFGPNWRDDSPDSMLDYPVESYEKEATE